MKTWPAILTWSLIAASPLAYAQDCIEYSPDWRDVVERCDDEQQGQGNVTITRAGVPYGTAPDWQNTLRRQVACVLVADIDGDGRNDLLAGCYQSSSFPPYTDWRNMIYRNIGTQLEAEPSWISADQVHTGDVQVADFNKDGYVDVFFGNGGSAFSPSRIYFGGPGGPSTTHGWQTAVSPGTWVTSALAFDVDHDGWVDIITTNQGLDPNPYRPIYMFKNNNGVVSTTPTWQSAATSIQNGLDIADIDGDGWEDLAVAKWVNFNSGIYRNINGTFESTPYWSAPTNGTDKGAGFADFNGDGKIDVVFGGNTSNTNPSRAYARQNDGTYTAVWASTAATPSTQEIRWMDVNNDGWPDLTEIHFSTGRCHIYLNNNGVLDTAPTWTYDAAPVGTAVNFGDINGDGCPDLIIGYSGEPSLVVFYHTGNCKAQCAGDIAPPGGDNQVGVPDLLSVISNWGQCPKPPASCAADVAPLGGDGVVGVPDLLFIISHWGPC